LAIPPKAGRLAKTTMPFGHQSFTRLINAIIIAYIIDSFFKPSLMASFPWPPSPGRGKIVFLRALGDSVVNKTLELIDQPFYTVL